MLAFTLGALLPLLTITLVARRRSGSGSRSPRSWSRSPLTGWASARLGYGPTAPRRRPQRRRRRCSRWRSPTPSARCSAPTSADAGDACGCSWRWCRRTEAVEHLDEFLARTPGGRRRSAGRPPEQFHVTLAFLAEVPDRQLDDLVERLERAAAPAYAVTTRIAGGGAFPNAGRARVLWAGLDLDEAGRTELARLATGARAAASKAGHRRRRPAVPAARHRRPARPARRGDAAGSGCSTPTRGPAWTADRSRWSRRTSARDRAAGPATRSSRTFDGRPVQLTTPRREMPVLTARSPVGSRP